MKVKRYECLVIGLDNFFIVEKNWEYIFDGLFEIFNRAHEIDCRAQLKTIKDIAQILMSTPG